MKTVSFLSYVVIFLVFPATAQGLNALRGFYVKPLWSQVRDPQIRLPNRSLFVVPEKKTIFTGSFGWQKTDFDWGGYGFGISFWKIKADDFLAPVFAGGSPGNETMSVGNISFGTWMFDTELIWKPRPSIPVALTGVFGMGARNAEFVVRNTEAPFENYNGSKSKSEFSYSYGLGLRLMAIPHLSLQADYRWFPGDETLVGGKFLYSEDGYNVYELKDKKTTGFTKILSLGAIIYL